MAHSKFAVFIADPTPDNLLPEETRAAISEFVLTKRVTARSIGIELLEEKHKLVVTLGYEEGPGPAVALRCVSLGKHELEDLQSLGKELGIAASAQGSVICHEFYASKEMEFFALFMCEVAS